MKEKPIVWLKGEVKTPPFSKMARIKAGILLRELQIGVSISMPDSRPMPVIGRRCHELRIEDAEDRKTWRIMYRIDEDAIVLVAVFARKTQKTSKATIGSCKKRLQIYDRYGEV